MKLEIFGMKIIIFDNCIMIRPFYLQSAVIEHCIPGKKKIPNKLIIMIKEKKIIFFESKKRM